MTDNDALSLGDLLRWARVYLQAGSSAQLDAELLLAHQLQLSRSFVQAHSERLLNVEAVAQYRELVQRRVAGEPIAYITGHREFWSLPLEVSPAVLIPRPETELVVERGLYLLENSQATVADLGTGSGAIALACAHERPQWRVFATDISAAALAVARRNAEALQLQNVEFLEGSWCTPLHDRRFELLLSNPPYIASGDPALLDAGLRHEPPAALASGDDGFDALREIVATARQYLAPGGWLVLEHGATQATALAKMLVDAGYAHVRCHADLAGRERVTEAQRKYHDDTV
jgi:release factor glutamine methyltransferase